MGPNTEAVSSMTAQRSEILLIDISNSFTKIARSSLERVGEVQRVPTGTLDSDVLRQAAGASRFDGCVLSSVVPEKNRLVEQFCEATRLLLVGPESDLGFRIDLPAPITTGADRLANAAYLADLDELPAVAVDFGTAVTFDVLTKGRVFVGGVIAPGLAAMASYLHDRTALLPEIDLREPCSAIGKTTADAMRSGAVFGYRGLVRGILKEIRREIAPSQPLLVVATGGYAAPMKEGLPEIDRIVPNLTLEGLRIIGKRSFRVLN